MSEHTASNSQSEPAIKLENLSKRFELIAEGPSSVLELLISRVSPSREPRRRSDEYLWAVKDIDLEVMSGECVGIIGQNGSGKSTLLKLIARILRPTAGRIMVRGRVSALLELGAGFHPDLTGRENIYLNASLLGLDRSDIESHFDAVLAFSELEEYINTPVKYYSSGMYMRLGFSVAAHVNPQILIIDEILAVGDQAFQEKCINHIYRMKQKGTTIVLVSHDLDLIRKLCTHLIWMEGGEVQAYGPAEMLIEQYLTFLSRSRKRTVSSTSSQAFDQSSFGNVELVDLCLLNKEGEEQDKFHTGESMAIEIHYTAHKPVTNPMFSLAIYRQDGVQVSGSNTQFSGFFIEELKQSGIIRYHIPKLPLPPANYSIAATIRDGHSLRAYDQNVGACEFRVEPGERREFIGSMQTPGRWEWQPQADQESEQL